MTRNYTWHDDPNNHPNEWFCSTEQRWKPKSEFGWRDKANGLPHRDCKECRNARRRGYYSANTAKVRNMNSVSSQNAKEINFEYAYGYLSTHPCQDCGQTNPALLTFDHVRGRKRDNVSNMINNGWSLDTIKAEIEKCEVVCFNCHMTREKERREKKKWLFW